MKNPSNLTAEELIEYISKEKQLTVEEIRKICGEWLKNNYWDTLF